MLNNPRGYKKGPLKCKLTPAIHMGDSQTPGKLITKP